MTLYSYGTDGQRRRLRWHCDRHRPLAYRGQHRGAHVFEAHATDGRTYELRLSAGELAQLVQAGEGA